uniref:Uncharacterized protein n=1 Tax=Arundo donax TaxID=35708 RepID=A0A0A9AFU6_ARUDO
MIEKAVMVDNESPGRSLPFTVASLASHMVTFAIPTR